AHLSRMVCWADASRASWLSGVAGRSGQSNQRCTSGSASQAITVAASSISMGRRTSSPSARTTAGPRGGARTRLLPGAEALAQRLVLLEEVEVLLAEDVQIAALLGLLGQVVAQLLELGHHLLGD